MLVCTPGSELGVLHERVLQAASRTTALNEQSLRRISADLHDGPGQVLALACLRLDSLGKACADNPDFTVVHDALRDALERIKGLETPLGPFGFTDTHDPDYQATVQIVHQGQFQPY